MESAFILAAVTLYLAAAFAWPVLRVWRRHRVWPIVFSREAAPAQRLLGWLTKGLLLAVVGTSLARVLLGAERLGMWSSARWQAVLGWSLLSAGTALTVAAQLQMGASWRVGIDDRPTGLVTDGVFRWVRNPIFTGLLIFLAGYALVMPSWWSGALWGATAVGLRVQIAWEERHLGALHGAAYLAYARRVGRLVPFVGRLHAEIIPVDSTNRS